MLRFYITFPHTLHRHGLRCKKVDIQLLIIPAQCAAIRLHLNIAPKYLTRAKVSVRLNTPRSGKCHLYLGARTCQCCLKKMCTKYRYQMIVLYAETNKCKTEYTKAVWSMRRTSIGKYSITKSMLSVVKYSMCSRRTSERCP